MSTNNQSRVVLGFSAIDSEHVEVDLSCGPMKATGIGTVGENGIVFRWKLEDDRYTDMFDQVMQELERQNALDDSRILELLKNKKGRKAKDTDDVTTTSNFFVTDRAGVDLLTNAFDCSESVLSNVLFFPVDVSKDMFRVKLRFTGYPKFTKRKDSIGAVLERLGKTGKPEGPVVVTQTVVTEDGAIMVRTWVLSGGKVHYESFPISVVMTRGPQEEEGKKNA